MGASIRSKCDPKTPRPESHSEGTKGLSRMYMFLPFRGFGTSIFSTTVHVYACFLSLPYILQGNGCRGEGESTAGLIKTLLEPELVPIMRW